MKMDKNVVSLNTGLTPFRPFTLPLRSRKRPAPFTDSSNSRPEDVRLGELQL